MYARFAAFLLFCSGFVCAADIRGKVVTADGGEPLARVQISVIETGAQAVTVKDGSFTISGLNPGAFTLRCNAVGYRLVTVPFTLTADEAGKEFEITLVPDNFRRIEKVEVKGDLFQGPDSPAINEINLTATEIRETSTAIADDPFRSVQTLPGVSASGNNDFFAQFSVMGASYDSSSVYLDGILVPLLFHGVNINEGATLSVLTSQTVEDIKLFPAAYPENYGDAVGAALDLHTRDGSRTSPIFRASVGLADADFLGEGAIGRSKRGSWLASARKSYLGYLLRHRLNNTFTDISFYDGDLKLRYDLRPNHTVTFYGVGGHTVADRLDSANLDPGEFKRGTNDIIVVRPGWRWTVNPRLQLDTRGALVEAPLEEWDITNTPIENNRYREWVIGQDVTWAWRNEHVLEGGWTARNVHQAFGTPLTFKGDGWRDSAYLQQASSFFHNRLHLAGGIRFVSAVHYDAHPVSPQISAGLRVDSRTLIQVGVGRYNQFSFPPLAAFVAAGQTCAPLTDYLQTADHYTAAIERRIGESTRLRAMFFDRENARQVASVGNCPLFPKTVLFSVGENYSRGVQIVLQSRTVNRLSGWIGYTLTYAQQNGLFTLLNPQGQIVHALSPYYPTLQDQRHTLNVFSSYRLTPSIHVSGKWLYGSGFPEPSGFFTVDPSGHLIDHGFNASRLPAYQRLDVRAEKDWALRRWKLALCGEMLNLTNHDNRRFISTSLIDPNTGQSSFRTEQGIPITPTVGVALEF